MITNIVKGKTWGSTLHGKSRDKTLDGHDISGVRVLNIEIVDPINKMLCNEVKSRW